MVSEGNALDVLYESANRLTDAYTKFSEGNKDIFKEFTQEFQTMLDNAKVGPK